jgi:Rod binding domain-containing protein
MIPVQQATLPISPIQPGTAPFRLTSPASNSSEPISPKAQKLRQAAAEFESMLMSSFWKSMKDSLGDEPDDATDPAHETLADFGMQAMCDAVGKAGGLGIGKLILQHLEPHLSSGPAK